jgi:hypothetical protein
MQVPARQTLPQQPAAREELSGQVMRVRARLLEKAGMQARRAVWGPTVKAWLLTRRRRPPPAGSPTEAKRQGSTGQGPSSLLLARTTIGLRVDQRTTILSKEDFTFVSGSGCPDTECLTSNTKASLLGRDSGRKDSTL